MLKKISIYLFLSMVFTPTAFSAPSQIQVEANQYQQDKFLEQQRELEKEKSLYKKKQKVSAKEIFQDKKYSNNCVELKWFLVEGFDIVKIDEIFAKEIKRFNTTCTNKNDWLLFKKDIENYYISNGYISARVYFDFSGVESEVLIMHIEEGHLEKIKIKDETGNLTDTNIYMAFPMYETKVINLRDIEQGIDQINRLSLYNVSMNLAPGDFEGTSILTVKNSGGLDDHFSFGYDNLGSESAGIHQANISYVKDDLFGWNDKLSLYYNQDLGDDEDLRFSKSYNIDFSMPYGYWTFSANFSNSKYLSSSEGVSGLIHFSGDTFTQKYSADRIISRGKTHKISISETLNIKDKNSYLEDALLENGSYNLTISDTALSWTEYLSGGMFFGKLTYSKALPLFDSTQFSAGNIGQPADDFDIIKSYAYFSKYFNKYNYIASFDSQYSNDKLFSSENFFIGGVGSVRGFRDVAYSGNSGFVVRQDLKRSLWGNFSGGVFLDYGYAKSFDGEENTISGTGLEVSYRAKLFDISATYATPIEKPNYDGFEKDAFYLTAKLRYDF